MSTARALAASLVLFTAACSGADPVVPAPVPPAPSAAPAAPVTTARSVDAAAMDKSVRPGKDFFLHANGAWYASAKIPADRSFTGVDLRIVEEVEHRTRALLDDAAKVRGPAGSSKQQVGDFYASFMDEAAIEKAGGAPLKPELAGIAKIKDAKGLAAALGGLVRADVDILNSTNLHTSRPLGLWVEIDLNDTKRNAPYLLQGGLGMPDRSNYLDESPRNVAQRAAYVKHLTALFTLAKIGDAHRKAERVFALEKKIAATHAAGVDTEDVSKGNNVWKRADFAAKAPGLDWDAFLKAANLAGQPSFIVWQPSAVKGLAALVKSEPVDVWRDYLTARAIDRASAFLSKAFVDEGFAFYGKELNGSEVLPPRWRMAADQTNDALGEAVGRVYVEKYFPPATKAAAHEMVTNLVTAFGRRIDGLTWMSPATKKKAKEKLGTLRVGVGYPDTWRDDKGLSIVKGDPLGNMERAEAFAYKLAVEKLGKPVDRGEWSMLPHVVNAVNLPVKNGLNFPAAILSPPYFDVEATAAANYGAIGSVIGHEISHSFDDQGAKFDAQGHYTNWWTPDDLAHFEASGAALAAQFSAYMPFPDAHIDGKLTLSENIADLAGLAVAYDAWRASLNGQLAPISAGFTGDQQFFLAYAQAWQTKAREERERQRLKTDGHAPPHYRVLTVRNLDAWYGAFDVTPQDPLFLAPNQRVRVW